MYVYVYICMAGHLPSWQAPSHTVCRPVGAPPGSKRPATAARYHRRARAAMLVKPTGHSNIIVTALAGAIMVQLARHYPRPPA